jgi:hypothetical protein
MKVLGLVEWIGNDKHGSPIARVRPLVEIQQEEWRGIYAHELAKEFPLHGLVFWPNAQIAKEQSLIVFRPEPNPGFRDEFRVVDPKPASEILDLREYGTASEVRNVLAEGIRLPGPVGKVKVLIWCKPNMLVGPVELNRRADDIAKLVSSNLDRLKTYKEPKVNYVIVDEKKRLVRIDESAPFGYVDWDDDAIVLRRALETAVRVAKQVEQNTCQTKKQIEEAARALVSQGVGLDAQLDSYRLERAISLLKNTDVVTHMADKLTEILREHPVIKVSLDEFTEKIHADIEQSARVDLEQRLKHEYAKLEKTTKTHDKTKSELAEKEKELQKVKGLLANLQGQVASASKEAEEAIDARVLAALDRPLDLLAEVSVLRPFLGSSVSRAASEPPNPKSFRVDWSRSQAESIKDKVSLRRLLTNAARAKGVDPSLMLQIHAAVVGRLMPVTLGPRALSALAAYAHGACGGRLLIIHVSPSVIQPNDFDELPGGGLLAAHAAASDIDGTSIVVLEGANRSPLEASVLPLLQLIEEGLSPLSFERGLRLAASLVSGATTVPVTPQFWSHAAAIYPEPNSPSAQTGVLGNIELSSELLVPGDEPKEVIDELLDDWPDCRELRPAMCRFGSALTRLYDDEVRVSESLLHGLILPYVATAFTPEEHVDLLDRVKDDDGIIEKALFRLHKRLA